MTRVISRQLGDKPPPIGKNQNGEHARNVGHSGVPPDDINLAWSAMVLLPPTTGPPSDATRGRSGSTRSTRWARWAAASSYRLHQVDL